MNGEELLVGIDLGTSSIKLGAFLLNGKPRFLISQPFRGNPVNPEVWWRATCRGLQKMMAVIGHDRILAICIGGQGPTLVGINQKGKIVGLAIPWNDTRSEIYAKEVGNLLCRQVNAGWSYLLRIYWLYREGKTQYDRTDKFMQSWDFLAYRLTGTLLGSELPWANPWPQADIELLKLPKKKLVDIQDWGKPLGQVNKSASAETGLPTGIPVIGGAGDATLSIIGSPGMQIGWAHNEGGSSGGISVLSSHAVQCAGLFSGKFVVPGWWMVGGPTSSGGKTIRWILADILGYSGNYHRIIKRALVKCRHPSALLFLPYLDGERAPIWDINAKGVFLGLSLNHSPDDLISAVVEGVTLGLKDILERVISAGVSVQALSVFGGQAYNPEWNQLRSDVFGLPVYVPVVKEAACLGAAAIGGWGIGLWPDIAMAGKSMSIVEYSCFPSSTTSSIWQEKLETFRRVYQLTKKPSTA
jgi:xylulokinase